MTETLWSQFWELHGPLGALTLSGWAVAWALWRRYQSLEDRFHKTIRNSTEAIAALTAELRASRR